MLALISTLTGSTTSDKVCGGVIYYPMPNGNFVVVSTQWHNGAIADAREVTCLDGATGITGAVSATNSLIFNRNY
jgi:hypothetical protein